MRAHRAKRLISTASHVGGTPRRAKGAARRVVLRNQAASLLRLPAVNGSVLAQFQPENLTSTITTALIAPQGHSPTCRALPHHVQDASQATGTETEIASGIETETETETGIGTVIETASENENSGSGTGNGSGNETVTVIVTRNGRDRESENDNEINLQTHDGNAHNIDTQSLLPDS